MKKLFAMALALLMVCVMLPVTAMADESSIDLAEFIKRLEQVNYDFDGLTNGTKLTVKWSPVSGCYDTREGHTCTVGNVVATANDNFKNWHNTYLFCLKKDKPIILLDQSKNTNPIVVQVVNDKVLNKKFKQIVE